MKKEIKELVEAMGRIKGESVEINTSHKLYGEQKLKCYFNPVIGEKIGFNIKGQKIYIESHKIKEVCLTNGICFADDVMTITIKTEYAT